jgi:2'-5'-oligoadenylate synthetase/2'-5'-oligoadenylate synthase-like protein
VKHRPANVKNLIRLVKYWKKEMVPSQPRQRIPTSYAMELITIHLWEKNKPDTFDTLKAFHGVMEALKKYKDLNVIWTKNYSSDDIPENIRSKR